jgi:ABC-2 type transport system ATP-binding protein
VKALEVQNLSFSYGQRKALDDVSFALPATNFCALVGPNGAGKTTLFALLTRLLSSKQGEIHIFGQRLDKHPGKALQSMGVVFQQSTLDLDLSIEQNLRYHAALHGMPRALANQRIGEQLERFLLNDRRREHVRALNQGHRRRVEFARALLHHPRLLLLDEATVGLDVETRHMINRHVRDLCTEKGVSVLWSSHLVDDIEHDDHLLLLQQGRLQADGICSEVMRRFECASLRDLMLKVSPRAA